MKLRKTDDELAFVAELDANQLDGYLAASAYRTWGGDINGAECLRVARERREGMDNA